MNYRTNEDKLCSTDLNNYNAILNVEDLSEDSGPVTEPVLLQEAKDYIRLEGFDGDNTGLSIQDPINTTLAAGDTFLINASLIGSTIVNLTREGTTYTVAGSVGALTVTFNNTTGRIDWQSPGASGGESVGIVYGVEVGGGTADVFTFDDDLIEDLITEAREWVEKFTGVHLVPKRLRVTFCNGNGMLELPGPVQGDITITGDSTTPEYIGTQFPKVKAPLANELVATYAAGYNYGTAPVWAKNAIKAYVADHYEYRGDDAPPAANKRAAQKCRPYRRVSAWA